MPNVSIQLCGSYDLGYIVMVSPWLVRVSRKKKQSITWDSSHPFTIKHKTKGNFSAPDDGQIPKRKQQSGAVKQSAKLGTYHYTISIRAAGGHIITIDPDYRIEK